MVFYSGLFHIIVCGMINKNNKVKNIGEGVLYVSVNNNDLKLNLSSEEKRRLLDDIKFYFEEERGENIGIIASENVFEFFMDKLGKYIYNKALDDTRVWYEQRMSNLESDFFARYK